MRYPLLPVFLAAGLSAMAVFSTPSIAGSNLWPVEIFDVMDDQKLVLFLRNEDIVGSRAWPVPRSTNWS